MINSGIVFFKLAAIRKLIVFCLREAKDCSDMGFNFPSLVLPPKTKRLRLRRGIKDSWGSVLAVLMDYRLESVITQCVMTVCCGRRTLLPPLEKFPPKSTLPPFIVCHYYSR